MKCDGTCSAWLWRPASLAEYSGKHGHTTRQVFLDTGLQVPQLRTDPPTTARRIQMHPLSMFQTSEPYTAPRHHCGGCTQSHIMDGLLSQSIPKRCTEALPRQPFIDVYSVVVRMWS